MSKLKGKIMKVYRPIPINEEIKLNHKKIIVSKTDKKGNILYVNDYFCEVTGYEPNDVIGLPHNIIRHPDMPRAIFYLMWQRIQNGENIIAVVKNLAKSGKYYWVTTDFETYRDVDGNIDSYIAFRRPASKRAIEGVEDLYSAMLNIEREHGLKASLVYLEGFLDERHTNYNDFVSDLIKPKSLLERLFSVMKKSFLDSHSKDNMQYTNSFEKAV
jgi:PAS domain S-box-containing protein